jgi:DNA-binding transcriptional ArsR family regulator
MGLRVHFTAADLACVRMAQGPDPAWETVLSAHLLRKTEGRGAFDVWRRQARVRLRHLPPRQLRLIRQLAPPFGPTPDFLTPVQAGPDLDSGIETILSTPKHRLRAELSVLEDGPGVARDLFDGTPSAVAELGEALRGYHRAAVAPSWSQIHALVDAERAEGSRGLLDQGVDGLLHSLRPTFRWSPPVLEADYPYDRDLHLNGRGVLLIPSMFCWRTPVTYVDPELPPVLVYPVAPGIGWWTTPSGTPDTKPGDALARLLGATRAAALRVIEDGCNTAELARRIGVSPPTASQHAAVLREARLIASVRRGNRMLHTLTPLGTGLLHTHANAS